MSVHAQSILVSRRSDQIVETAKQAYSLSLISVPTLERVVARALTIPGYDPHLDFSFGAQRFPYPWEIREASNGSL